MSLSHAKGGAIGAVARGLAVWLSRLSLLALALSMAMAAAHMPAGSPPPMVWRVWLRWRC